MPNPSRPRELYLRLGADWRTAGRLLSYALALLPLELASENLSVTSSNSGPSAIYAGLTTVGHGNAATVLARDFGVVGVGFNPTASNAKLDVSGFIRAQPIALPAPGAKGVALFSSGGSGYIQAWNGAGGYEQLNLQSAALNLAMNGGSAQVNGHNFLINVPANFNCSGTLSCFPDPHNPNVLDIQYTPPVPPTHALPAGSYWFWGGSGCYASGGTNTEYLSVTGVSDFPDKSCPIGSVSALTGGKVPAAVNCKGTLYDISGLRAGIQTDVDYIYGQVRTDAAVNLNCAAPPTCSTGGSYTPWCGY